MAQRVSQVLVFLGRSTRRIAVSTLGALLFLVGVALLVLPGPGLLVIALSLAVLSSEYPWASRALERTRHHADRGVHHGRRAVSGLVRAARTSRSN